MGKKENLEAAMNRFLQEQSPENQIAMVREIMKRGGSLKGFVPDAIVERLQAYGSK